MDKGQWQKTLVQITTYKNAKNFVPEELLNKLVEQINPSFKSLGLAGIGAEGIAVIIETGFHRKYLVKAALPEFAVQPVKQTRIYDFTRKFRKIVEKNNMAERFREGCLVQMKLATEVLAERLDYLHIPQIIQIHEVPLFVQMEYVEGVTLLRWLRDRKNLLVSLEYFEKLLRAFDFVHKRRVVYRDLKADHVLVTGEKAQKIALIDWTLAKEKGERNITKTGSGIGTFPLASPQAFWGDASDYRYSDDIFGLGFLLWQFVTLKDLPYIEPTDSVVVLQEYIDALARDLPIAIAALYRKYTAIDREKRYLTVEFALVEMQELMQLLKTKENQEIATVKCECRLCRNPNLASEIEEILKYKDHLLALCKAFKV